MKKIVTLLALGILMLNAHAQTGVYKYAYTKDIDVTNMKGILSDPWAGGLNNPQFNTLDVNFDCYPDLIVFDRDGQNLRVFINDTSGTEAKYYYAPEYAKFFPNDINDILLIRDYNNDGKPDIFTNNTPYPNNGNGLKVYKNISDTVLKFELLFETLPATNGSQPATVYVGSGDFPTIDDIDGDGDLDIISKAQVLPGYRFFENRTTHLDSFDIHYRSCWGHFSLAANDSIQFNDFCKRNSGSAIGQRHSASSSITTIDLNQDGVKEALIGHPDKGNIIMLINGGTPTTAHMVSANYHYPDPTADAINVTGFVSIYNLDVHNDGKKDMIAAPNQYLGSRDTGSVWLYRNWGLNDLPNFQLQQKDFLGGNQIDVGTMAFPVLADISGDNIPDLLIGNIGYFQSYNPGSFQTYYKAQIAYYRNNGTANNPSFEHVTDDLAGISARNLVRVTPTFADIDGDGDNDMLFGEVNGSISYYENTAPIGNEANFVFQTDKFMNQNFGIHPSPFLYDINNNNLLDLLVGQKNGHIKLYLNQGSTNAPIYTTAVTDTLGGIFNYVGGYQNSATPFIGKVNGDTNNVLMVGGHDGWLYFYDGFNTDYMGTFNLVDSIKISNGPIAPTVANINSSDSLELIVGERSGGVLLFNMDQDVYNYSPYPRDTCGHGEPDGIKKIHSRNDALKIYPNPNNGNFNIQIESVKGKGIVTIYDLSGKVIVQQNVQITQNSQQIEINQHQLKPGIYIVSVNIDQTYYRKRLIVQ